MNGLTLATCDRELASGPVPEWVHLFPPGRIAGRDGRAFELADPGGVILAFEAAGLDLPVDYEHQNDKPEAKLKGPVPAAGWIKELDAREDGIWGRVEWTATAREMIANREYRYLSPSFLVHPKTKEIARLKGAGLVHNPNFHLTAIAAQEDNMNTDTLAKIAEALGLDPTADAAAILDAIRALVESEDKPATASAAAPDPAKFVPIEALHDLIRDRHTKAVQAAEERAEDKVERAMEDGYITHGMKRWALELAAQDEASFDAFIASTAPPYAHLKRSVMPSALPPGAAAPTAVDPNAAAICAQLGLDPKALA